MFLSTKLIIYVGHLFYRFGRRSVENMFPIIPAQDRETSLVSTTSALIATLRDCFICCCQMSLSPQWQRSCCTARSPGRVPVRCLGPCVWCCCWVPCTARLCRPSPAGGPQAVQPPAAPPALHAGGGAFLIVRHRTLICLQQNTLTTWHRASSTCKHWHITHANGLKDL